MSTKECSEMRSDWSEFDIYVNSQPSSWMTFVTLWQILIYIGSQKIECIVPNLYVFLLAEVVAEGVQQRCRHWNFTARQCLVRQKVTGLSCVYLATACTGNI